MDDVYQRKYRIASARLAGYDYSSNGIYFVTICTADRVCYFGDIAPVETQNLASPLTVQEPQNLASLQKHSGLRPTAIGAIAIEYWQCIPEHFPFVELDAFQVMPNHLHGLLWIHQPAEGEWKPNRFGPQSRNLASIIRGFKAAVKKYATLHELDFAWQPRYYDRVVRNAVELDRIRMYIAQNPMQWVQDQNNPENLFM